MLDILLAVAALAVLVILLLLFMRLAAQVTALRASLEDKHRAMLTDLHGGLAQQSDPLASRLSEELNQTRATLPKLPLAPDTNPGEAADKPNAKIDQQL